jgi:spore coat protein U-like protein
MVTAAPANAATTSNNLGVSATVRANCTLSTSPVAFGTLDVTSGTNTDATGGISVVCTKGTAWSASANGGSSAGATPITRKMASGADLLNYDLYTNSTRTTIWGDGVAGSTITGTGTGIAQASTIYGRVPLGQTTVPAGSYADTVAVTVTY